MPGTTINVNEVYELILSVDLDKVPTICTNRCIPRKQQAALTRQLFKVLGIKGISVRTPNYSMARSVDVRIPRESGLSWKGYEQYEHLPFNEVPDFVPLKAARIRHGEACEKVEAILDKAFPNHGNRSDYLSDYYDFKWNVE